MQPFFNSTRATIISWPTTNCRCSSGLSSSSGMVCQGMYWRAAVPATCLVSARLAREWDFLALVLERVLAFDFVFAMRLYAAYFLWQKRNQKDRKSTRLNSSH